MRRKRENIIKEEEGFLSRMASSIVGPVWRSVPRTADKATGSTLIKLDSWNVLADGPTLAMSDRHDYCARELRMLRTQLTIESNSLRQQNLIGYLIANLKPKLREERASQIHIPSWKLHFVSHLCSEV